MDSSSVAAVAKEVRAKDGQTTEIRGYSCVYESLIPDQEESYARELAGFLQIPVKFQAMDQVQLFEEWDNPEFSLPEPVDNPLIAGFFKFCRIISAECRVLLSGEGNDNLMLFQMWPYVKDLQRNREWLRLFAEVANFLWVRPFPWRGIRARFLKQIGRDPDSPVFPGWLAPDFVRRMSLEERWKEGGVHPALAIEQPIHSKPHASLFLPHLTQLFRLDDAGTTHNELETRYPFLDLRIVNYLLAIPPFPWCFQKMLLREAMAGRLPERVRGRPQTPLQGDPILAQLRRTRAKLLKQMPFMPEVDGYREHSARVPLRGKISAEPIPPHFL